MKVLLMHPTEPFEAEGALPPEADSLVEDLGLSTLLGAMAGRDKFLGNVSRAAMLKPLSNPDEVLWRQQALADCVSHPEFAQELYTLAVDALENHRRTSFWGLNQSPESLRFSSVESLTALLGQLVRLRGLLEGRGGELSSPAFTQLRSLLLTELDEPYLNILDTHLNELKLSHGLYMSAQLGRANKGTDYLLHRAPHKGLRERFADRNKPSLSFSVPERDEAGMRALTELQAKGVNLAANALAQSVESVLAFFTSLRTELAFYMGCLNLRTALAAKGVPLCVPGALPVDQPGFRTEGLYDPSLSLMTDGQVVGNDVDADGKTLVVVTGANRGGKSTFLRSVGIAHLMMQCGMFVAARSFSAGVAPRLFTHFKRNEDPSMKGGKLDEDLARMSRIISSITPGCMLLSNEPFGSTNEREGSDIARQVFLPLLDAGIRVLLVTHLFDLAESLYNERSANAIFLRAPRQKGARPFRLVEGAPEATAYGEDVYLRVFGERPGAARPPRDQERSSSPS